MGSIAQDLSPDALVRLDVVERRIALLGDQVSNNALATQDLATQTAQATTTYANQNYLRNGNFDLDRNHYLYDSDYGGGTVPADVSEECAHWYSHPANTAVESIGNISSGSAVLTINDPLFIGGDSGVEIVVVGAGAAGADLVTTISGAPASTTTATLAAAASTTVSGARVRWRLLKRQEDSTDMDADGNQATCTAIKTTAHSRYATTVSNPDYDKVNGYLRISSSANTIDAPLPHNYFTASKHYIVSFLYKLANAIEGDDQYQANMYMGFYDNTPGRRQFMEGTELQLAASYTGTPGPTTREYFVLLYLPWGGTVGTAKFTLTNTAAVLDTNNYVTLSWDQPAGITRSEIYRNTGGVYEKLLYPYPAQTYYDRGQTSSTVTAYPVATQKRPMAYIETTSDNLAPARSDKWQLGQFNVPVPSTYATPASADKQWFVMGLKNTIVGGSSDHALLIDLVCVDDKYGTFSRSPLDFLAKRQLSTTATSGDQGGAGTPGGDGGIDPGDGRGGCPVFGELIETDHGDVPAIDLVDNEHRYQIIDRYDRTVKYKAEIVPAQPVATVIAGDRELTASLAHPVFTDETDQFGTKLKLLSVGDTILTKTGTVSVSSIIHHPRPLHTVRITLFGQEKGFWQNGFGVHNVKPLSS